MKKIDFRGGVVKLLLGIEVITLFLGIKSFGNKNNRLDDIKLLDSKSDNLFAIMIKDASGNYNESSTFPTGAYVLNETMSSCVDNNGNKIDNVLSYSDGVVSSRTNKTVYCYLYFDKNSETILTITASNGVESFQTVQFEAEDENGIAGVYYGMDNPEDTEVNYSEISDGSTTKSVQFIARAYGIYYFSVKDIHGMVTTTSREFFETKFSVENGSVTPASVITLKGNSFALPTPRAKSGYTISTTWHGNGTTYESGSTYTPTTNSTLTANSSQNSYNVTLTITNGTTTSINPQSVLHGSSASFAITPNTGYDLVLASDTCSGTLSGSTYTVSNVTSAKNCAITLKKKTYTFRISLGNATTSSTNPQTIEHGGSATYVINPKDGYDYVASSDTCGGTFSGKNYIIPNITSDTKCTLILKKKTYTFRISLGNATTSSTNPQTIEHGGSATYVINPKDGYDYVASSDTCGGTFSGKNYIIPNITSDKSCTLILKKKSYKISLLVGRRISTGTVQNTWESLTVNHGENAVFSVYTDDNYNLYNSYLNVNSCGGTFTRSNGKMTYTLSNVTKNMECEIEITYNGTG